MILRRHYMTGVGFVIVAMIRGGVFIRLWLFPNNIEITLCIAILKIHAFFWKWIFLERGSLYRLKGPPTPVRSIYRCQYTCC